MGDLGIRMDHIKVTYDTQDVFSFDHLTAYKDEKIAIVGENGVAKSTLLKLIYGVLTPSQGSIERHVHFNYMSQLAMDNSVSRIDDLDFKMLSELNVPENEWHQLSGGEKRKLTLTHTLSSYSEGLLLDEPTTHMDAEGIQQLIDYLKYYYGLLIFVSHDRDFINALATKIWEINDHTIEVFSGNYDAYVEQKEEQIAYIEHENDKKRKEKERLMAALEDKQKKAEKVGEASPKSKKKNIKPNRLAASKQKDTVQKSMFKNMKNIEQRIKNIGEETALQDERHIDFPTIKSLEMHNNFPIMGEDIYLKLGNKTLFDGVRFQVPKGERLAIVGDNGVGKTSLLNYIVNEQEGITISQNAKIKVYNQMDYIPKNDQNVLAYLGKNTYYHTELIRNILINLGFDERTLNHKKMNELSGGESTKISIAKLLVEPSNILILDEPTNFIDVHTIEALERLLKSYKGTVIFTSHDQKFIAQVATQVWRIEDGKIKY